MKKGVIDLMISPVGFLVITIVIAIFIFLFYMGTNGEAGFFENLGDAFSGIFEGFKLI
ncbi:MAG: hypothetical protein ABIJ92_05285 [Candidatus Aenigmatarchaeota archaeon]